MKEKIILYVGIIFLSVIGIARVGYAAEGCCQVFLVQVPDKSSFELSEQERVKMEGLVAHFASMNVSVVYVSDELWAQEVAGLVSQHHDLSAIANPALNSLRRDTLFQRVEGIRTFAMDLVEENRGKTAILITHESVVRFIGRYLDGGFRPISDYSYIEVCANGESPYLSR